MRGRQEGGSMLSHKKTPSTGTRTTILYSVRKNTAHKNAESRNGQNQLAKERPPDFLRAELNAVCEAAVTRKVSKDIGNPVTLWAKTASLRK